ncbi:MAG: CopG family transcriptional regulator [Nitrososphaerales archaeon]
MSKTSVITVKIPKELKERMKEVDMNWSEYIRSTIMKKIEEHELKNASAKLDEIRAKAKPVSTSELISWIREDRSR